MTSDGKNKAGYFNVQQKYIEAFNIGDVDTSITGYQLEAVINAKFIGADEISSFWNPFIESGASEIEYSDVKLEVVNA